MKQCPNCKTAYTDDSLQFCLSDGTNLVSVPTEAVTAQMNFGGNEPLRVNIPSDSAPTVFAAPPTINYQPPAPNQPARKSFGLIAAGLLGIMLLLIVSSVAAYFLLRSRDRQPVVTTASPTPTAAPAFKSNEEIERLKEETANLKKQLENQKNQKQNLPVLPPTSNGKTAYADSPRDGFLALRSEPSSETGFRVAKIPHGAELTVFDCPKPSNVGKMSGRWCRVSYNGQSGWAFDGFMKF